MQHTYCSCMKHILHTIVHGIRFYVQSGVDRPKQGSLNKGNKNNNILSQAQN